MQDLQLSIEVDGSSTEQAEYIGGFATAQGLYNIFNVDHKRDTITILVGQSPEAQKAEDPDPTAYANVVREIVDAGSFKGIKAKFFTTDEHMLTRVRTIIPDLGLGNWATAARLPELPFKNLMQAPQAAAASRGTLAG